MSRAKIHEVVPEDIEEEELDEDEDEDDMDGGMDMFEALGSLLATEEGETIASSVSSLKDAAERIAVSFEMQNKILVKILSAMGSQKCTVVSRGPCAKCPECAPAATPEPAPEA